MHLDDRGQALCGSGICRILLVTTRKPNLIVLTRNVHNQGSGRARSALASCRSCKLLALSGPLLTAEKSIQIVTSLLCCFIQAR